MPSSPPMLEYAAPPPPVMPTDLRVVAWLFVGFGVLSVAEMGWQLLHGRVSLNLNVLMIFVGRGLLQRRSGWRVVGLIFCWIVMIGCPLLLLVLFMAGGPGVGVTGQPIGPRLLGVALLVGIWVLFLWKYRVLTRPAARELFERSAPRVDKDALANALRDVGD